jgi:hypothetical protein
MCNTQSWNCWEQQDLCYTYLGITDTAPATPYRCPILQDTVGYVSDTRGGAVDPIAGHRLQRRRHMRLGLRWLQLSSRLVTSPAASSACCWLAKPKFSSFYFTFSSLFLSVCLGHGCAAPSNTVSATSSFRKEEEAIKNCRDCYFTYVYT